jgi:hypothetical protein
LADCSHPEADIAMTGGVEVWFSTGTIFDQSINTGALTERLR